MSKAVRPVFAFVLPLAMALAQTEPPAAPAPASAWLPGYERDLAGVTIDYDSALPAITSALLVRSRREEHRIAWATAPVPEGHRGDATFAWLYGMDAEPEAHTFTLRCGERTLRFRNPATSSLEPAEVNEQGLALRLRPTRIDRHGDVFGFATLRVPPDLLAPGRPLELEVRGDDSGSRIWCMTFRGAVREEATLEPLPAVREGEPPFQPVWLHVAHLGEPTRAVAGGDLVPEHTIELQFGSNRTELRYPPVDRPTEREVRVRRGAQTLTARCVQQPVRPWTVHLVQHTHTDIGYTRPQTEILPEHLRYLDCALDYCDQTDGFPDDARFRWSCEAAWPVREWLRARPPGQLDRLRRRVAEGRIEVTAMAGNLSELLDRRSCEASLLPLRALHDAQLPVVTAMQNDVNGVPWPFADLLPELGVRYLTMGENGHRALVPFPVPTAFWWESPAGRRLLAFRADHYLTGNLWSLHQGREDRVAPELFRYLEDLQRKGYPFDRIAVQYSGTTLDNSPPAVLPSEFVREWNERHLWPRLRSSLVSEFLQWVEREHGERLPVHRQAWPDWWSDGLGSAPREVAAARAAQDQLRSVEAVLGIALLGGAALPDGTMAEIERTRDRLVMYGEHTYGAAESITEPDRHNTRVQWAQKSAWVWQAAQDAALLQERALGLLQSLLPRADVPTIAVCNPRGQELSGMVRFYADHALLPPDRGFRVVDASGAEVPHQRLHGNPDGTWWGLAVRGVPPFGIASFHVLSGGEVGRAAATAADADLELASPYYRVRIDRETGGIASLFDLQLQRELVDAAAPCGFGQLVHEVLGDRAQLERLRLERCERTALRATAIERTAEGPLFTSVTVRGAGAICPGGFACEVRLFQLQKRIELHYRVHKRPSTDPEALYAAFPFALPDARIAYDLGGAMVDPERGSLPGTSSDWHAAQGGVLLRAAEASVLLGSRETLLWQFGGLHVGRFQPVAVIERPHAYAWLTNNYWTTNFLADEPGELRWSFAITSRGKAAGDGDPDRVFADWALADWALAEATPALCRVLPGLPGQPGRPQELPPGLELDAPNVIVHSLRPDRVGTGLVLHVQAGASGQARVAVAVPRSTRLQRVTGLDEPLGEPGPAVQLGAGEHAFLRLCR